MAFTQIDVAKMVVKGPITIPFTSSSGKINKLIHAIPTGGIQDALSVAGMLYVPSQT